VFHFIIELADRYFKKHCLALIYEVKLGK